MRSLKRIVPVSLCLMSALVLTACERSDNTAAKVQPASQTKSETKAAPAKTEPVKPAPSKIEPTKVEPIKADSTKSQDVKTPSAPVNAEPSVAATADLVTDADSAAPKAAAAKPGAPNAAQPQRPQPPTPPAVVRPQTVKAEPPVLDMGDIPTSDSKKVTLKLVNLDEKPATIIAARPSCGCTALKFTPNTVIPGKESLELEVQMAGPAREGEIHGKTVTFTIEGQPDLIVQIKGKAVSFVSVDPATLDPETNKEGKFKLRATDGQPFRIMSAMPDVLGEYSHEPAVEHELTVSWEKYRQVGLSRQTMVYLDHPKCQQVFVPVNFKPEDVQKDAIDRAKRAQENKAAIQGERDTATNGTVPQKNQPVVAPPAAVDADTQLLNLIKDGNNDEVFKRIATGLDVNYRDSSGLSLLGMAAKVGNVGLMEQLVATKKVDINAADNVGRTALMHAATSKNVAAVKSLLDAGANPSLRDSIGGTALTWAAGLGDPASVKELIHAGADVDVVGAVTGWTPLIWAAGFGEPDSIGPLLDAHANIEIGDFLQGATPLIFAARTGKVEAIKVLVARGAKIENTDRNGNTALLAAAANAGGTADKVQALIDAHADVHAKDNRGLNALDLARKRTDIRAAEVIKLLEPILGKESAEKPASQ